MLHVIESPWNKLVPVTTCKTVQAYIISSLIRQKVFLSVIIRLRLCRVFANSRYITTSAFINPNLCFDLKPALLSDLCC